MLERMGLKPDSEDKEQLHEDAKADKPSLFSMGPKKVSKIVRSRWDRHDDEAQELAAQLKVNYLRYLGHPFAQVHPDDPNQAWLPPYTKHREPPTENRIERAVDRYAAQITADDPVIEGVPARSTDEARDAAEAATSAMRGETERMRMLDKVERVQMVSNILRSGFWHFEWDPVEGGRTPARMFIDRGDGERELVFVAGKDEQTGQPIPVESPDEARQIFEGNLQCEVLTPLHVRFSGARYAHDSDEVMVGKLVTLRKLYEMRPESREEKLEDLLTEVPCDADDWLDDLTAKSFKASDIDDEWGVKTGDDLDEDETVLDRKAFVLHYYQKPSRAYPDGVHAITAGKVLIHRGPLRWGVIPVAQFKCLESMTGNLGRALVDLLKDPQELLDFVNTKILDFLQSLRKRWFVPIGSDVKKRDLMSPTASVIPYNAAFGEPVPEQPAQIPNSLMEWAGQFSEKFDDKTGIHETMQGKHVPGVSSGRHAEALRAGDETLLGLTRGRVLEGLVAGYRIILKAIQKEWTLPRRVSYWGEGRQYIEDHFSKADFGDTDQVRLKRGTMLMLTPAQKTETLFTYFEMGLLSLEEMRRMAPLVDTAGLSVTEDPHYQRARRQNQKWLKGPPEQLMQAFQMMQEEVQSLQQGVERMGQAAQIGLATPAEFEARAATVQDRIEQAAMEWQEQLQQHAPVMEPWEQSPEIAATHARLHFEALSRTKAESFPPWWRDLMTQHAMQEGMMAGFLPMPQAPVEGEEGEAEGEAQAGPAQPPASLSGTFQPGGGSGSMNNPMALPATGVAP